MSLEVIILIYLVGIGLLVAEAFLPGAIAGVIGSVALILSIYLGFTEQSVIFGIIQFVIALAALPLVFFLALKKLALKKSLTQTEGFTIEKESLNQLLGMEGVTLTKLRPSGIALINHKKVDVVTEGGMLESNTKIKVIKVESNRVIVRPLA
jgi:membrane-bound serine protease (ClpP class)